MPHYKNCGIKVNPNMNYNKKIGATLNPAPQGTAVRAYPTYTPPPPLPPPPPAMPYESNIENTVGILLLRKPKSLGRYDSFTGVITNRRMIFAQMTSEMLKDAAKIAKDQAKTEGKGFWGQWSDQLRATFAYAQRYRTMPPSAILAETQGNFAVDNNAIHEIKLKLKDIGQRDMDLHEFEIEIASHSGKFAFRMDEKDDYVKLLKQVHGDKVKTPLGYFSSHGFKISL